MYKYLFLYEESWNVSMTSITYRVYYNIAFLISRIAQICPNYTVLIDYILVKIIYFMPVSFLTWMVMVPYRTQRMYYIFHLNQVQDVCNHLDYILLEKQNLSPYNGIHVSIVIECHIQRYNLGGNFIYSNFCYH